MPSPADTFTAYADALYAAMQARDAYTATANSDAAGWTDKCAAAEHLALADSRAFSLHRQLMRETIGELFAADNGTAPPRPEWERWT